MIHICITIEERSCITSAEATASDEQATTLEKNYLAKISASLGREGNPIHLHATQLVKKHQQIAEGGK
jgi:hypothetical protein